MSILVVHELQQREHKMIEHTSVYLVLSLLFVSLSKLFASFESAGSRSHSRLSLQYCTLYSTSHRSGNRFVWQMDCAEDRTSDGH